jgi:hypothetical protein
MLQVILDLNNLELQKKQLKRLMKFQDLEKKTHRKAMIFPQKKKKEKIRVPTVEFITGLHYVSVNSKTM